MLAHMNASAGLRQDVTPYAEALSKINADYLPFCPANVRDPVKFYVDLLYEMARYESGFDVNATYYECNKKECVYSSCKHDPVRGYCMRGQPNVDAGYIVSRGLYQLSYTSAKSSGCKLLSPESLNGHKTNIKCAYQILSLHISRDKTVAANGKGGARYWSVLRPSRAAFKGIKRALKPHCT